VNLSTFEMETETWHLPSLLIDGNAFVGNARYASCRTPMLRWIPRRSEPFDLPHDLGASQPAAFPELQYKEGCDPFPGRTADEEYFFLKIRAAFPGNAGPEIAGDAHSYPTTTPASALATSPDQRRRRLRIDWYITRVARDLWTRSASASQDR
jgi:hypothetical protein